MTLDASTLNVILVGLIGLNAWLIRELHCVQVNIALMKRDLKRLLGEETDEEKTRRYRHG